MPSNSIKMEENLAILIADLSGYTALTETHGSASAADLIEKYINMAETCLVGDSKVQERVGDEIMIVSTSADSLLQTAVLIAQKAANEDQFLQVHGGLHFGKVLKRGQSYFGSAINLTARIASNAKAGTVCCSKEFVHALEDQSSYNMCFKGIQYFKNVREETEVFELDVKGKTIFHIDPVCRMLLLNIDKAIPHPSEKETYFCSIHCLEVYDRTLQLHNK